MSSILFVFSLLFSYGFKLYVNFSFVSSFPAPWLVKSSLNSIFFFLSADPSCSSFGCYGIFIVVDYRLLLPSSCFEEPGINIFRVVAAVVVALSGSWFRGVAVMKKLLLCVTAAGASTHDWVRRCYLADWIRNCCRFENAFLRSCQVICCRLCELVFGRCCCSWK